MTSLKGKNVIATVIPNTSKGKKGINYNTHNLNIFKVERETAKRAYIEIDGQEIAFEKESGALYGEGRDLAVAVAFFTLEELEKMCSSISSFLPIVRELYQRALGVIREYENTEKVKKAKHNSVVAEVRCHIIFEQMVEEWRKEDGYKGINAAMLQRAYTNLSARGYIQKTGACSKKGDSVEQIFSKLMQGYGKEDGMVYTKNQHGLWDIVDVNEVVTLHTPVSDISEQEEKGFKKQLFSELWEDLEAKGLSKPYNTKHAGLTFKLANIELFSYTLLNFKEGIVKNGLESYILENDVTNTLHHNTLKIIKTFLKQQGFKLQRIGKCGSFDYKVLSKEMHLKVKLEKQRKKQRKLTRQTLKIQGKLDKLKQAKIQHNRSVDLSGYQSEEFEIKLECFDNQDVKYALIHKKNVGTVSSVKKGIWGKNWAIYGMDFSANKGEYERIEDAVQAMWDTKEQELKHWQERGHFAVEQGYKEEAA